MKHFAQLLTALEEYRQYIEGVEKSQFPVVLTGLSGVHKALMIYASCVNLDVPALVLCPDEAAATRLCEDVNALFEDNRALVYPARDFTYRDADSVSHEYEQARLSVLGKLLKGETTLVFCSVEGLSQLTIPPQRYRELAFDIASGEEYRLPELIERLIGAGYVRADQVDGMCQFSLRGGILDIYPPDSPYPVRVEFWGDEVDTLSYFDVLTQRRLDPVERVSISPAREVLFSSSEELIEKLEKLRELQRGKAGKGAKENINRDIQRLRDHLSFASFDRFLPLAYGQGATLLDYLPEGFLFVSDYIKLRETQKNFSWQMEEDLKTLFEEGVLCRGLERFYLERGELKAIPQNEAESSYVSMIDKAMGRIDFSRSAAEIDRLIRGLYPWPSAFTSYKGKTLKIWEAAPLLEETDGQPGSIERVEKDAVYVNTGKGILKVTQLQLEGKKRMQVKDFLLGCRMEKGDMLGC